MYKQSVVGLACGQSCNCVTILEGSLYHIPNWPSQQSPLFVDWLGIVPLGVVNVIFWMQIFFIQKPFCLANFASTVVPDITLWNLRQLCRAMRTAEFVICCFEGFSKRSPCWEAGYYIAHQSSYAPAARCRGATSISLSVWFSSFFFFLPSFFLSRVTLAT